MSNAQYKFGYGNRVRVYNVPESFEATVIGLTGDGLLQVQRADNDVWYVHPKQCRKLRRKTPMATWAVEYTSKTLGRAIFRTLYQTRAAAQADADNRALFLEAEDPRVIKLRVVKEKA